MKNKYKKLIRQSVAFITQLTKYVYKDNKPQTFFLISIFYSKLIQEIAFIQKKIEVNGKTIPYRLRIVITKKPAQSFV